MINCEISIITKIKENGAILRLAEINNANYKNQKCLYEIQSHMYFLEISSVTLCKGNYVTLSNTQELSELKLKFNLNDSIYLHEKNETLNGVYDIDKIQLYDITCMQPIFDKEIVPFSLPKQNSHLTSKCMVLLLPYDSILKRGTLIESCFYLYEKYDVSFVCINDANDIADVNKKYLLFRGVQEEDIDVIPYNESVLDDIIETILSVDCLFPKNYPIYIAIDFENICGLSAFLRKFRERNKTRKLRYITNSAWAGFYRDENLT